MYTTLSIKETRMATTPTPSHTSHSLSPSLLHIESSSSNRGRNTNSYRGGNQSRRGGDHTSNNRRPSNGNPNGFGNQRYG